MESLYLPKTASYQTCAWRSAASGDFNYSSVVGMLLYLAGHTCPDITYAVNSAAKQMFYPKLVHEYAVKQTGCYLKATSDNGSIMKSSDNF